MIEVKERVTHDGKTYEPGQTIGKIKNDEAQRLVDLGVAFFVSKTPRIEENHVETIEEREDDNSFEGIDLRDLKEAAKEVGVQFNANIGFEKLVERIREEGKVEDVLAQFEDEE